MDGKVGPEYLTGAIRQESEDALALIQKYVTPQTRENVKGAMVGRGLPPDQPWIYGMAADFLGAMRWYTKVVAPAFDDAEIQVVMNFQDVQHTVAMFIGHYEKLPPSFDRDQALNILGW
jgi:hypothetical protein